MATTIGVLHPGEMGAAVAATCHGLWKLDPAADDSHVGRHCYAYALLAMGHLDVIIEATLAPWDVAALVPIVENAGGMLTDWSGAPVPGGGRIVAAGDPRVHAEVLEVLEGYPE